MTHNIFHRVQLELIYTHPDIALMPEDLRNIVKTVKLLKLRNGFLQLYYHRLLESRNLSWVWVDYNNFYWIVLKVVLQYIENGILKQVSLGTTFDICFVVRK